MNFSDFFPNSHHVCIIQAMSKTGVHLVSSDHPSKLTSDPPVSDTLQPMKYVGFHCTTVNILIVDLG